MYVAGRRPGWRGRVGYARGVVRLDGAEPVLLARSPAVARALARLLNGEVAPSARGVMSPLPRYRAHVPRPETGVIVIGADAFSSGGGALGDGLIATTVDSELAERLVRLLNDFNPATEAR